MSTDEKARLFADDPTKFFNHSINEMGSIPRKAMKALQLAALQIRFNDLRDKVPMLKKLADEQGIEQINSLDDVVPLLFEHTMYKSYPASLLEKGRFTQINKWLNKLTSHDISEVDVSHCQSIDEWLAVMEKTDLRVVHSSGTTGTMSFIPHSEVEFDMLGKTMTMTILQNFGDDKASEEPIHVIFPYFRSGYNGMLRGNDITVKHISKGEENFHAAYEGRMSSDLLYLAARIKAAQAKGMLDRLKISDEMKERQREFSEIDAKMPEHMDRFYEEKFTQLKGKRIWASGTWNLMHKMATSGLEKGQENMFSPDSVVLSGGGAKGLTPPDNWQDDVCKFIGVNHITMAYGMSEIFGHNRMCSEGRYHMVPWVIPFVLDPATSEVLPREGKQTGRAAFFGLLARHAWGGFITGDEITIDWDSQCACGQTTYHLDPLIQRFSDKTGDDDKITCAATPDAHKQAMTFLSNLNE